MVSDRTLARRTAAQGAWIQQQQLRVMGMRQYYLAEAAKRNLIAEARQADLAKGPWRIIGKTIQGAVTGFMTGGPVGAVVGAGAGLIAGGIAESQDDPSTRAQVGQVFEMGLQGASIAGQYGAFGTDTPQHTMGPGSRASTTPTGQGGQTFSNAPLAQTPAAAPFVPSRTGGMQSEGIPGSLQKPGEFISPYQPLGTQAQAQAPRAMQQSGGPVELADLQSMQLERRGLGLPESPPPGYLTDEESESRRRALANYAATQQA